MNGIILSEKKDGVFFYIQENGKRIFSMEELCYYLYHNIYEITPQFFSEELFDFLTKMGRNHLVSKLNVDIVSRKHYIYLVLDIIFAVDYYSYEEKKEIERELIQITRRTPAQNKKARADLFMRQGKIWEAFREYKSILQEEGATEENMADAWNNLGVVYAESFLYEDALKCFECAMDLTGKQEYLDNIICGLIMAERGFNKPWDNGEQKRKELSIKYQISEDIFAKYEEIIAGEEKDILSSQDTIKFKEQFSIEGKTDIAEFYHGVDKIIGNWKAEYRQQEKERQLE